MFSVKFSKEISKEYPTDVWAKKEKAGLNLNSIIQGDQIRTISKERIVKKLGHFDDVIMKKIDEAIRISLGL
ncbi:MAG: type II toxin-antitoxin system PemK/MazF family toxin [Atribacterota bacterium]